MSLMLSDKTDIQVQSDMIDRVLSTTKLKDLTPGSTLYGLIRGASEEYSSIRRDLNTAFGAAFLDTASGVFLDIKAAAFGMKRVTSFTTVVPCSSKTVAIRTKNGAPIFQSLADSSGAYRVIGVGYDVKSADSSIVMSTSESCYFSASDNIVYLSVSGQLGNNQQLSPGTLAQFAWADCPVFTGATISNLELVQILSITGIQQVESEDEFRARVKALPTTMATSNAGAITSALITNPEVAYVRVFRNVRGTGSANFIVVPVARRISYAGIKAMQQAVDSVKSFGEDIQVKEPVYVPVLMTLTVKSVQDSHTARTAISNALRNFDVGVGINHSVVKQIVNNAGVQFVTVHEIVVDGRVLLPGSTFFATNEELLELSVPITLSAKYESPITIFVA